MVESSILKAQARLEEKQVVGLQANAFDERPESSHTKMVRLVGENKRVLEIGCGWGAVSQRLKQNGNTVVGIEIDREKAKTAKSFCKQVLVEDVEKIRFDFTQKQFDIVLFGDVLEHLKQPRKLLERVKPCLAEYGHIVISVPNVANWRVRLNLLLGRFDYEDQGILDKTHLRFFTRKNAENLIEGAGYKIVESDFVPSFPFPFFKKHLAKINPNAFAYQFIFVAREVRE